MKPLLCIILCTHNGARYLSMQLDSILRQDGCCLFIVASDDGSQDETRLILDKYKTEYDNLSWSSGPCLGLVANFMRALRDGVKADYFAFSDQDDVWCDGRVTRALEFLKKVPQEVPALYVSRTAFVDEKGIYIGKSTLCSLPPSFRNALVQNIASGNTMVFNCAARDLLIALSDNGDPAWHDWALYQVVTACGGRVLYDPEPTVLYRQHSTNAIGGHWSVNASWRRLRMLFHGRFRDWNGQNLHALEGIIAHVLPENRELLRRFIVVRQCRTPWGRVIGLYRLGLYRQTRLGQLGLYVAAFFKLM